MNVRAVRVLAVVGAAAVLATACSSSAEVEQLPSDNGVKSMTPAAAVAAADRQMKASRAVEVDGWARGGERVLGERRIRIVGVITKDRSGRLRIGIGGEWMSLVCVKGDAYTRFSRGLLREMGASRAAAARGSRRYVQSDDASMCGIYHEFASEPQSSPQRRWRQSSTSVVGDVPSLQLFDDRSKESVFIAMTGPVRYTGVTIKPGKVSFRFDLAFLPDAPAVARPDTAPSLERLLAG